MRKPTFFGNYARDDSILSPFYGRKVAVELGITLDIIRIEPAMTDVCFGPAGRPLYGVAQGACHALG